MRKKLLTLTVLGTSLLAGCSNKNQVANDVTELTFWHSMGGKGGEAITALVDAFNESQDEIRVVAEYQGAYDDAVNKLKSSALGNAGPDIMQLYEIGTKWMIDSEYAIPMQDFIDEEGYDVSHLEENILDYYTIDDKLYSMPFNTSTPILYYNKTAFEEVGLNPEVAPTNFDEILEYSEKLTKKSGNITERYGYAMQIYGWFFEQFLIKQQLDYANEGNGRDNQATAVTFDTNQGALNIINGWKTLVDSL